jgi:hypothetical protein
MFFSLCDLHLRNHLFAISAIIRVPEVENQGVNGVIPQVANRDVFLHINRKFLYLMATPSCYIKKNQEPLASYQKVCVHQELTFFVNAQGATLLSNAQGARCAQVTTKLKFVLKPSANFFLLRACSICQVQFSFILGTYLFAKHSGNLFRSSKFSSVFGSSTLFYWLQFRQDKFALVDLNRRSISKHQEETLSTIFRLLLLVELSRSNNSSSFPSPTKKLILHLVLCLLLGTASSQCCYNSGSIFCCYFVGNCL